MNKYSSLKFNFRCKIDMEFKCIVEISYKRCSRSSYANRGNINGKSTQKLKMLELLQCLNIHIYNIIYNNRLLCQLYVVVNFYWVKKTF